MAFDTRLAALAALALSGCDLDGEFLFSKVEGLPSVYEITAEDGGPLVPVTVTSLQDIRDATIYGELAASETSLLGGATFTFLGTGGNVCIWVDPEVATWNTSISSQNSGDASGPDDGSRWQYPDNPFDDGDLDLTAGLSVYYTGSPEVLGGFEVAYEDSLGIDVPISLAGCPGGLSDFDIPEFAGKGQPEFCTLSTVGAEGVSHTVVMRSFSVPTDDSRLGFGMILARGSCRNLFSASRIATSGGDQGLGNDPDPLTSECLIIGEAQEPVDLGDDEDAYVTTVGFANVADRVWPKSLEFEEEYCFGENIQSFCEDEAEAVADAGTRCSWEQFDTAEYDPEARCFCGDPNDMPDGAAF